MEQEAQACIEDYIAWTRGKARTCMHGKCVCRSPVVICRVRESLGVGWARVELVMGGGKCVWGSTVVVCGISE